MIGKGLKHLVAGAARLFGGRAAHEARRMPIPESLPEQARKRFERKDPLYLQLQGFAARKFGRMKVRLVDGKSDIVVPVWMLRLSGNSPQAAGYVLRRDFAAGTSSTLKKVLRAKRIAAAEMKSNLQVPSQGEAPHIHPRRLRTAPVHLERPVKAVPAPAKKGERRKAKSYRGALRDVMRQARKDSLLAKRALRGQPPEQILQVAA